MQLTARCPVGLTPSSALRQRQLKSSRQPVRVVRAEAQPPAPEEPQKKPPATAYIDELPEIKRTEISPEMRAKLLKGQYSLGGAPNRAATPWILYISLFIGSLAILSWLSGAI